jgi:hypothetical protein
MLIVIATNIAPQINAEICSYDAKTQINGAVKIEKMIVYLSNRSN